MSAPNASENPWSGQWGQDVTADREKRWAESKLLESGVCKHCGELIDFRYFKGEGGAWVHVKTMWGRCAATRAEPVRS